MGESRNGNYIRRSDVIELEAENRRLSACDRLASREIEQLKAENARLKEQVAEIYESGRKDGRAERAEARDASCRCLEFHMENKRLRKQIEKLESQLEEYLVEYG